MIQFYYVSKYYDSNYYDSNYYDSNLLLNKNNNKLGYGVCID